MVLQRKQLFLSVLLIALLLGAFSSIAAAQNSRRITVAIESSDPHVQVLIIYLPQYFGLYRKHGLDVALVPAGNVMLEANAVLGGSADFGIDTFLARPNRRNTDQHLRVEVVLALSKHTYYTLVGSVNITRLSQLGGKKVISYGCGNPVGLAAKQLRDIIAEFNRSVAKKEKLSVHCGGPSGVLNSHTLYIIPIKGSGAMVHALENGDADAVTTLPVHVPNLLQSGKFRIILTPEQTNGPSRAVPSNLLVARHGYTREHPEVIQRMRNALIDAYNEAKRNPERTLAAIAFHFKLIKVGRGEEIPQKLPDNFARRQTAQRFYNQMLQNVPSELCLSRAQIEFGIRFYAGKPNLDLRKTITRHAVCKN